MGNIKNIIQKHSIISNIKSTSNNQLISGFLNRGIYDLNFNTTIWLVVFITIN